MISNGFRHCDILRSHSFDSVTFLQHHAVQFGKTLKRKMLVFVPRDLWAAWELERPHPLFMETSCCPLSGSDWSSEYAWSWNSECKNTSFWCHQSWQNWGLTRWTKGEMHFFPNHYLQCKLHYICLSLSLPPPNENELNWSLPAPLAALLQSETHSKLRLPPTSISKTHWGRLKVHFTQRLAEL